MALRNSTDGALLGYSAAIASAISNDDDALLELVEEFMRGPHRRHPGRAQPPEFVYLARESLDDVLAWHRAGAVKRHDPHALLRRPRADLPGLPRQADRVAMITASGMQGPAPRDLVEVATASPWCPRRRHGTHSWRHIHEGGFDARRYSVAPVDEATARAWVRLHHYTSAYPAASQRYGLFGRDGQL